MSIIFPLLGIVVLACICMIIYCGLALRRNEKIYHYRIGLVQMISTAAESDIDLRRNFQWRYDAFDSVTYDQMMKWPWRDLDSYYPDKSFILPQAFKGVES